MKKDNYLLVGILILIALSGLVCLLAGGFAALSLASGNIGKPGDTDADPTPEIIPTIQDTTAGQEIFTETIDILETTAVSVKDPFDLAWRFLNKRNLPEKLEYPARIYEEGDQETFWVNNSDTNTYFQVLAVLRYVTDHVYFWIQDGVDFNTKDMKALVDTFEKDIYPTNREFFGSEWTPGVDADPHLFILYTNGLGGSVAGYFSSADEYLPIVQEYSNGHEMFLLSAEHIELNERFAYSVLAHEFQHMIHWYRDRNEDTWLDEGLAELASFLNGYMIGGHDRSYAQNPDIQLTEWPNNSSSKSPNYGGSFLFVTYFLDRFGEQATKALVSDPENGMTSVDSVLQTLGLKDPITSSAITADDFFLDWLVTNILQDSRALDGRYDYRNYPAAPNFNPTETIAQCPVNTNTRSVYQYGVNYQKIQCKGDYLIRFSGSSHVPVIPADPHSGDYVFYSNRGNESNMTLTREFDFTDHAGPLTFSYWTWYDLEKDYDYVYLTASRDGEDWQILTTPSGTAVNPSGNSYGWAYNGVSAAPSGWIQERVDISQYAGEKILLRFEYVTDAAVNGEGFLLDDVAVPETGYAADFETDDGGWQADGFVRIQNKIPQTFRLALVNRGRKTAVQSFSVEAGEEVEIPLTIQGNSRDAILVVTGTSRFTRQKAVYSISIQPK